MTLPRMGLSAIFLTAMILVGWTEESSSAASDPAGMTCAIAAIDATPPGADVVPFSPLGAPANETRLAKMIDETMPVPRPDPKALPLPPDFPHLTSNPAPIANLSGRESEVQLLGYSNHELADNVTKFNSDDVRQALERRLQSEKDPARKLFIAALASKVGSRPAAHYLLDSMMSTDYDNVRNVQDALGIALYRDKSDPPTWIVELVMATLADQRHVTSLEKHNWAAGTVFTISYLGDEHSNLTWELGHLKCRQAVPLLIDMAGQKKESRGAIFALGEIGDERAIPVLMEILHRHEPVLKIWSGTLQPENFERAAAALANLKAPGILPILLKHPCHESIVNDLEALGDRGAIPALEKIVTDGRPQQINGSDTESNQNAVGAARVALATLKEGDPVPRYCELLADRSLGEFHRRAAVWRLGNRADPRAIPFLIQAIKSDPSGSVVNQSITVLATFKHKAAVKGLIDCFEANFAGKSDWKRAFTPQMFNDNIAEALHQTTGQTFGTDRAHWLKWWEEEGKNSATLQ